MSVNIPQPLIDLLNKTDHGYVVYAHMVPTRIFRIVRSENWCTFRVEQLHRTNRDNLSPKGTWATVSTHGDAQPGAMLQTACLAAKKAQEDFQIRLQKKLDARIQEQVRRIEAVR